MFTTMSARSVLGCKYQETHWALRLSKVGADCLQDWFLGEAMSVGTRGVFLPLPFHSGPCHVCPLCPPPLCPPAALPCLSTASSTSYTGWAFLFLLAFGPQTASHAFGAIIVRYLLLFFLPILTLQLPICDIPFQGWNFSSAKAEKRRVHSRTRKELIFLSNGIVVFYPVFVVLPSP